MPAVKMYTTAVCPYCIRAKQLLNAQGRGPDRGDPYRSGSDPSAAPT
jgi:glutaredoxin 3